MQLRLVLLILSFVPLCSQSETQKVITDENKLPTLKLGCLSESYEHLLKYLSRSV